MLPIPYTETTIATNGVNLHVIQAGPADGPLVILLHGFPEFWYGWRRQIPALVEAGYRVWAPDQRGYNLSSKPAGMDAYRLGVLAQDVVGLIDAAGVEQAHGVIGHDWGAAVAWWVGMAHRERIQRLGILNVPHPSRSVARETFKRRPSQLLKSWYIFFFQIPRLPEWLLSRENFRGLAGALHGKTRESFTPADLAHYRAAWSQPGALTGMLNWYRAMIQRPPKLGRSNRISVPTLILWGEQDVALSKEMAPLSLQKCDQGRLVTYPDATHWLQHDEPDGVNGELLGFLGVGV
jgi:pimeloyl-ACP methyl ester carboxylesterase